ncbi:hypothetical protein [Methylacidimicrobium cyclopophantes]|uniref:hypothetical protein n=1 Tax=Methylacidimicrobium cyclopophantes TaxID=1041766 RepID=UPI0011591866|nr:hypothetical protein [Methylacidimicrobium cyclopophantes]
MKYEPHAYNPLPGQFGQWQAVSTNVGHDLRWNVMPLEQMELVAHLPLRFFHWNGPVRSKP